MIARAVCAVCLTVGFAHAEPTRDYVVRDRETCLEIAVQQLGDQGGLAALHRLNPQLGALPHHLVAGQVLKLPLVELKPDAELAAPRGQVEVRRAGSAAWNAGAAGQDLFRTWRVGTRERSTAKVKFADTSTIDMREDTVVVIFGPAGGQQQEQPLLRTTVERGALRSRLAALDGPAGDRTRIAVTTPAGVAELVAGSAVVEVDAAAGETRLSNHSGKPASLANGLGRVVVAPNYGSKVVPKRPPTPPRPLPAVPAWTRGTELVLAWRGEPATITGTWVSVGAAVKYRVEVARAETPAVVEWRLDVPATIVRLEAQNLPVADYVVTVASVDAAGFESRPSEPLRVQMIELERPATLETGSELRVPAGLACRAGRVAPESGSATAPVMVVRDEVGRAHVTCASATGSATLALALSAPRLVAPRELRVRAGEFGILAIERAGVTAAALAITGRGVEIVETTATATATRITVRARASGSVAVAVAGEPALVIPVYVDGAPSHHRRAGVAFVALGGVALGDTTRAVVAGEVQLAPWRYAGGYLGLRLTGDATDAVGGLLLQSALPLRPAVRLGVAIGSDRAAGVAGASVSLELAPWLALRAHAELVVGDDVAGQLAIGLAHLR